MAREVVALRDEIRILRQIVNSGSQLEFPWFRLPGPRRRQVEAVISYLREHRDRRIFTLPRACEESFVPVPGGYPNPRALAAYCYGVKLEDWIAD